MPDSHSHDDMHQLGLIASSYDAAFTIRKRVRAINGYAIPIQRGVAVNQIGVGMLVFVITVIVYGMLIVPLMGLLHIGRPIWLVLAILFGPAALAAQRISKPMPHGKAIGTTISSWVRARLDDRVHRRGRPVSETPYPRQDTVLHYQRIWEPAATPGAPQKVWSTWQAQSRLAGGPLNLQEWLDSNALANLEATQQSTIEKTPPRHSPRGHAPGVIAPTN